MLISRAHLVILFRCGCGAQSGSWGARMEVTCYSMSTASDARMLYTLAHTALLSTRYPVAPSVHDSGAARLGACGP